jgi:hypothetical protein
MTEYTWNELNDEGIEISMGGHQYRVLNGPEELTGGWWAPGLDEAGKPWDLYFERSGIGLTESFQLTSVRFFQEAIN